MELKEATYSQNSVETKVGSLSDKNSSKRQDVFNVLFSSEDEGVDQEVPSEHSYKNNEKPKFRNVSTLDWLKTWRSIEIS